MSKGVSGPPGKTSVGGGVELRESREEEKVISAKRGESQGRGAVPRAIGGRFPRAEGESTERGPAVGERAGTYGRGRGRRW